MNDDQLRGIVSAYITEAKDFAQSELGRKRTLAYDYYWQKPFGNETEGRSQVIDATVATTIDSAIPALVKTFVASDNAVEFLPRKAEDVEAAEQATELANYVFYSQNNGFQLVHDCLKDGALQVTGMFKWRWKKEGPKKETYRGLSDQEFMFHLQDPQVEIVAYSEQQSVGPEGPMSFHDVTVQSKLDSGKVEIFVVPPDEQLISPSAPGMDLGDHRFIGTRTMKTISELIEMGYYKGDLEGVETAESSYNFSEPAVARLDRLQSLGQQDSEDPSQRLVEYVEGYVRIDYDGDGIAELRRVCMGGTKVLHNEETDHIPLAYWTPKVMPHEPVGMSMAEECMDIQYTKSMLVRNILDSLYLSVSPRMGIVEGQVNIDDVLTVRPGGLIRMTQPNAIQPVETPFVGQQAFSMVEYLDAESEARTGVSRLFQGIDPNSLNKTATGVTALMNAAQARIDLIARNFAENALKPLFRGIMYLLQQHQQQQLVARLRNNFVPIDPRVWETDYDMTINVGLGTGTKDQQLQHLQALGADLAFILQGPFGQQLLDAKKFYNFVEKKSELLGFKDASQFVNDPDNVPPPQPQPPVELQVQQMKGEQAQQQTQAEAQTEMAVETMKAQLAKELETYKAELKAHVDLIVGEARAQAQAMQPRVFPGA